SFDRTENVRQHFNPVTPEVEHRASARLTPVQQPGPRIIRPRIELFEGINLREHRNAQLTRLNYLFDACDHRVKMAVVSDAELYIIRSARGDHRVAFSQIDGHRLLTQHMFAGFSCRDGLP